MQYRFTSQSVKENASYAFSLMKEDFFFAIIIEREIGKLKIVKIKGNAALDKGCETAL